MTIDISNLYDKALEQGIEIDYHESDLYLKGGDITRTLLRVAHVQATPFISNIDESLWYEIPFAYAPFWRAKP